MRHLNEVMDLKFSLLIFKQFHESYNTLTEKNVYAHLYDSAQGTISMSGFW